MLERLEKLGLGGDVRDVDNMWGIAKQTDPLMLVAQGPFI